MLDPESITVNTAYLTMTTAVLYVINEDESSEEKLLL